MPDLATKESAVADTTRDDIALPKWPFHSALSLNYLYLLTLYLIPTAQRMTVRYLFLFLDTLNVSSFLLLRAIWGFLFCASAI